MASNYVQTGLVSHLSPHCVKRDRLENGNGNGYEHRLENGYKHWLENGYEHWLENGHGHRRGNGGYLKLDNIMGWILNYLSSSLYLGLFHLIDSRSHILANSSSFYYWTLVDTNCLPSSKWNEQWTLRKVYINL